MKKSTSLKVLFWKEFSEARWGMYVGLLLFLLLPVLEMSGKFNTTVGVWNSSKGGIRWVMDSELLYVINYCGYAFAMIFAVAMVCHDMSSDDSPEPWRLLPIKSSWFITVKFLAGICMLGLIWSVVVAFDALVVISLEMIGSVSFKSALIQWVGRLGMAIIFLFLSMGVYAISFAISSLLRRGVCSAIMAAACTLLICFLPMMVPALERFNIWEIAKVPLFWLIGMQFHIPDGADIALSKFKIFDQWVVYNHRHLPLLVVFVVIMLTSLLLTRKTITNHWRLNFEGQQLGWFFVIVGLGLFALAAQQVGNNLTPEKITPISKNNHAVYQMVLRGNQALALTFDTKSNYGPTQAAMILRRINLASDKNLADYPGYNTGRHDQSHVFHTDQKYIAWHQKDADYAYLIQNKEDWETIPHISRKIESFWLQSIRFDENGKPKPVEKIDLSDMVGDIKARKFDSACLYLDHQYLWVSYQQLQPTNIWRLRCFDVSEPAHIKLISRYDIQGYWGDFQKYANHGVDLSGDFSMPVVKGMSHETFVKLKSIFFKRDMIFNDQQVIKFRDKSIQIYAPDVQYNQTHEAGHYLRYVSQIKRPYTPMERWINAYHQDRIIKGQYLYVLVNAPQSGVMVFDIADSQSVKKIGYYYAPGERLSSMIDMPGDKVGLAGFNLHVLDPATWK